MAASMCQSVAKQVPPVVVVLGATGTGKSKLAVDIAKKFHGDIISADSMQVYKGLDIITNKVTQEEQDGIPHHLLGMVNPLSRFTVVDFRDQAVPLINELRRSQKMPVIVGGTNYYIEALLWKVLVEQSNRYGTSSDRLLIEDLGAVDKLKLPRSCLSILDVDPSAVTLVSDSRDSTQLQCGSSRREMAKDDLAEQQQHSRQAEIPVGVYQNLTKTLSEIAGGIPSTVVRNDGMETESPESTSVDGNSSCPDISDGLASGRSIFHNPPQEKQRLSLEEPMIVEDSESSVRKGEPVAASGGGPLVEESSGSDCEGHCDYAESESLSFLSDKNEDDGYAVIDVDKSPSPLLHKILCRVDPEMASKLHPNDKRKIVRSLQVFQQHGVPHSQLLEDQRDQEGGGPLGGPLRYQNPCIFWLQTDPEVLDVRLDKRAMAMVEAGLVEELSTFHKDYNKERLEEGSLKGLYEHGIFQSIGFKEFHPYLILPEEEKATDAGKQLLLDCIERLKIVTRQYARKQLKWIRNRFLKRPSENGPPVYGLDSSDPDRWQELVYQPAVEILTSFMEGNEPTQQPLERQDHEYASEGNVSHVCGICDGRIFVGSQQWKGHVTSRRHKKRVAKARKMALNERWQEATKTKKSEETVR